MQLNPIQNAFLRRDDNKALEQNPSHRKAQVGSLGGNGIGVASLFLEV